MKLKLTRLKWKRLKPLFIRLLVEFGLPADAEYLNKCLTYNELIANICLYHIHQGDAWVRVYRNKIVLNYHKKKFQISLHVGEHGFGMFVSGSGTKLLKGPILERVRKAHAASVQES